MYSKKYTTGSFKFKQNKVVLIDNKKTQKKMRRHKTQANEKDLSPFSQKIKLSFFSWSSIGNEPTAHKNIKKE